MCRNVLFELRKTLLYLFCPAPCLACGTIDRELHLPLGLCRICRGRLRELRPPFCRSCALPLPAAAVPSGYRCGLCRRRPPAVDRLTAHWLYGPPLDRVVLALKFRRLRYLGHHLGSALAERLAHDPPEAELVVPVPLHWSRELGRGYNQAREIATAVASRLDLPMANALHRRRATRPQMRLEVADRQTNLRRAFRCRRPKWVKGRAVLLIDDVATTGATLDAAAETLRRARAGPILAAVVARTPEPAPPPEDRQEVLSSDGRFF